MSDSFDLLDATGEFRVQATPWFLDARLPREKAIVSHGHSDHLGKGHALVLAHPITCELLKHRLAEPGEAAAPDPAALANGIGDAVDRIATQLVSVAYGEKYMDDDVAIEMFPAGHVLGSAMVRATTPRGRLLYTGDFRWQRDALTVPPCDPPADGADVLLMECTYGMSRYRFPPRAKAIEQLCDVVAAAFAEGKQPVCLCYSLGKAQEIARQLCTHGFAVAMHAAAFAITSIYERCGVHIGDVKAYAPEPAAIESRVLIVPPHIRNSRMVTNIKNAEIIVITGWAIDSSTKYRYQAQHALAISDHADFDELNEFVDVMRDRGVKQFLLTHGFVTEFCRHLRARGLNAAAARPPAQGTLFDD
jgi:putative mRNA 3-end processing factor